MLQNQNLTKFAQYWGDLLISDTALQTYCQQHFSKNISVCVAPPEHYLPGEEDAPFIFLHNPNKHEGMGLSKAEYSLIVSVGLVTSDADITTAAGTKIMAGQKYMSDILEKIQAAIYNDCKAAATIEQDIPVLDGANPSFWAGFLYVKWDVDVPLGYTNYFE